MSDLDPRYTDKRTVERYLRQGMVDEKVWEKHLKALPDLTDKSVAVESTLLEDIDDEIEE